MKYVDLLLALMSKLKSKVRIKSSGSHSLETTLSDSEKNCKPPKLNLILDPRCLAVGINPKYLEQITSQVNSPKYEVGQEVKIGPKRSGRTAKIERIWLLTNHAYKHNTDPEKLTFGYGFAGKNWYEEKLLDFYQTEG